jgi:alkyldihydroxyacetonephosphate synthase
VEFSEFQAGAEAARAIAQARLHPSNCRLLEDAEVELTGAGDGSAHLLLLGFESADHDVGASMDRALSLARDHGGEPGTHRSSGPQEGGAVESWRGAFLLAPYLRDTFVACGVLSETFETAITWERFEDFHASVMEATRRAAAEVCGVGAEGPGAPRVSCRLTHVYPDGAAPYFTVIAPAIRGGEVEQWDELKAAVSETIIGAGGTITHHHAVGRDHRPWYDRQRPAPFAAALRAAKAELDPAAILNPGVLIDPA